MLKQFHRTDATWAYSRPERAVRESGCLSLAAEAIRRAVQGETTIEEALRVTAYA